MSSLPASEAELDTFLTAFECGTLPKERWTHAAHIYLPVSATERMRHAVRRYNVAVGGQNTATSGYHETITDFWIKLLAELRREFPKMERAAFTAIAVERYGTARGILAEFYDFNVVGSEEARRMWVPPTRKSLP